MSRAPFKTDKPDPIIPGATWGDVELLFETLAGRGAGAIERQEAAGQASLVQSDALPTAGLAEFAASCPGLTVHGPVPRDEIFTFVTLPPGWTKRATSHDMWSDLLDERGRKRASIFYKAAFYDRKAHMRGCLRYRVEHDYQAEDLGQITTHVLDGDQLIKSFTHEQRIDPEKRKTDRDYARDVYAWKDENTTAARVWLTEQHPDWEKAGAYWDE